MDDIQVHIQDWNQSHDFPENIVSGFMKSINDTPLFEWVFHLGLQHFLTSCWNPYDVGIALYRNFSQKSFLQGGPDLLFFL